MVVGKGGWLRIVESIFGIMIMVSVLLIVYSGQTTIVKNADYVIGLEREVLRGLADDYNLRKDIFEENYVRPKDFIKEGIPSDYSFVLVVCNLSAINCDTNLVPSGKEVYTEETIFSSLTNKYDSKRLRLFVWPSRGDTRIMEISGLLLPNGESCTDNIQCASGNCNSSICTAMTI